jgi:hypothetical protein
MQKKTDPMIVPTQATNKIIPVRIMRRPFTKKRRILTGVIVTVVVLVIAGCWWYQMSSSSAGRINSGQYQAIFTTNNQAYFGKLQRLSDGDYRLTNVYYLQQQSSTSGNNPAQKPSNGDQTPQLVKLGNELHGPEDEVIFDSSQVLFWENLKSDGKVAKAIEAYIKK